MIDPIIFQFKLFGVDIILRWYGVLVMLGAVAGAWLAEREIRRRGENGEAIWDAMVWVLPAGILGARLWYVVNNILGGSTYYTDTPSRIFNIPEGGLHFFGGLLFGGVALYFFLKSNKMDFWLFLDAIAPAVFIGQALARPANYINQELYGQPTNLPWGIPIDAGHRLAQYANLSLFPVETTRFHPTFAYEMILNILLALLLLWLSRQYVERMKPGAIFSIWLIFAGLARAFIEFFRPDQPLIGDTFVTYSMFVSLLMAVAGVVMLLVRFGKLQLAFAQNWEEDYQIKPVEKKVRSSTRVKSAMAEDVSTYDDEEEDEEEIPAPVKKKTPVKRKTAAKKPTVKRKSSE
ncbi:MAG: prolipoprotein diacylglyceryl transferase [Anaerolineales bacterium]|nr:prolipoprotein diacylglyceryl transferase [Anaerolineales bacterium]